MTKEFHFFCISIVYYLFSFVRPIFVLIDGQFSKKLLFDIWFSYNKNLI